MNHCVCFMEWDHPHSMLATQTSLEPGSYSQRSRQTWFSTSLESYVSELHWNQSERQILVTLESTECWMPDSVYIYIMNISQRCSNERVLGSRRSHFLWRGESWVAFAARYYCLLLWGSGVHRSFFFAKGSFWKLTMLYSQKFLLSNDFPFW